ncbi:polysaccharide deacetylase family protein [Polluticoccus soli]|uniref:polysaccharide deacetylase family protein n=1 Tax=Polluticoccus soli TaxID=3034150 RepID=UPI0023E246AA|nr:polysaccharide deacetylase family protein [Flavipsychrobacter sp. JY13-12]
MAYSVKTPWWLRSVYGKQVWRMPKEDQPAVYLTFDDGPHPTATPFVLDQLKQYGAKATFFCIGKNIEEFPDIYQRILDEGHTVGNHTQNHVNGWKTDTEAYLDDVKQATKHIKSKLFRPPYGRISRVQSNFMIQAGWKIIMWDVLSGDFDLELTPEKCLQNVEKHMEPGSIVVFHDSEKAWARMYYALPKVLAFCKDKNWELKAIPNE